MSSPNEPANPRAGERPPGATNGSAGPGHDAGPSTTRSGPVPAGASTGSAVEPAETPPWQRGGSPTVRTTKPQQRTAPETTNRADGSTRGAASPAPAPSGMDARLNRFIAGGPATAPAPEADQPQPQAQPQPAPAPPAGQSQPTVQTQLPARSERVDAGRNEAYPSELPDLSGPMPRPPQRKPQAVEQPPARAAAPTSKVQVANRARGPVRASMQIRRIDPWSALKVSLVLSVALFFVWMIAVAFLYLVLGGMGVWSKLNSNVGDLLTSTSGSTGGELVSSGTVFGGAALIGLVNIVILTGMATVAAFIYNLTTDLVGGVEVTLADRD